MFKRDSIGYGTTLYAHPHMAARDLGVETILRRLPVFLAIVGMAASTVALWFYVQALPTFVQQGYAFDYGYGRVAKPALYYAAHGVELFCLCSGGLVALSYAPRHLIRRYVFTFSLFFSSCVLMTLRGYSLSGAISAQIFANTGPFVFIVSVVMFVGVHPGNWKLLDKLFLWMAITYSAFVVVGMGGVHSANRWEAILALQNYLNVLFWPATWLLLRPGAWTSLWGWFSYAPLAVYAAGSILTQSRLNCVMTVGALGACTYLQRRRHRPMVPKLILAVALGLGLILISPTFLNDTQYVRTLQASANAFLSRIDEDTRTGQLIEFFKDVHISELLLGRGSLATWNWTGSAYTSGTDVGYLSLLFFGGVPLLFTYILVHIAPALGAISHPQSEWQRSCAAIALLWALRMCSSEYPTLTAEYYLVLLCMGGCLGQARRLPMRRTRQIGVGGWREGPSPI